MDTKAAYREVGAYRGATTCGTTYKTVRRVIEADEAPAGPARTERAPNYDVVRIRVRSTARKILANGWDIPTANRHFEAAVQQ